MRLVARNIILRNVKTTTLLLDKDRNLLETPNKEDKENSHRKGLEPIKEVYVHD